MSSWNNLNLFLSLDEKFQYTKKDLTNMLIQACMRNSKEEIIGAMKSGAYVNSHDDLQTPIMATVENGTVEVAQFLLKLGANPSVFINNKDAIWLSLLQQKYDFLDLFYMEKYRQNSKKETGETPLIHATKESDLRAVEIIAYKVNVNQRDNLGNTALHYNFQKPEPSEEDVAIAKILMACGADTNAPNNEGVTCRDLSSASISDMASVIIEHEDIVEILPEIEETAEQKEKQKFKL